MTQIEHLGERRGMVEWGEWEWGLEAIWGKGDTIAEHDIYGTKHEQKCTDN